jgi:hypothetical protein
MIIAIVGSRDFDNYDILEGVCINAIRYAIDEHRPDSLGIVSGGATGADRLAETFARVRLIPITVYPADWSKGKGAGHARNSLIVAKADFMVAFYSADVASSRGTNDSMRKARAKGIPRLWYVTSNNTLYSDMDGSEDHEAPIV